MDKITLKAFFEKYANNSHTEAEHELFINWLNAADPEQVYKVFNTYQAIFERQANDVAVQNLKLAKYIEKSINESDSKRDLKSPTLGLWPDLKYVAIVAAVLVLISFIYIFFNNENEVKNNVIVDNSNGSRNIEISPGGNRATLTLSNGSTINLDHAKNGVLISQTGLNIRKSSAGRIIYEKCGFVHHPTIEYNVITTPRGGQYQVVLPDGSQVWLNAASSLKFPTSFSNTERVVELTGEAYFEIAKVMSPSIRGFAESHIPFKVISGKQTLEVLGTHFNINAYPDEKTINTTLLEGSVKILKKYTGDSVTLKPGQQAKSGIDLQVTNVNTKDAIAWKNGYFIFSHENIESIMRKISRWYDVDIEYKENITKEGFVGKVSRFENVSQVLNILQLTGSVRFKIESLQKKGQKGRRILVLP
jgi:transmembrane sensor